jgi:glycosyltransferase involved in cell wall biosynthesis
MFPNSAVRKLVQFPFLLILLPFYLLESLLRYIDCTWNWWMSASQAALRVARRENVELIYSTGGPASAHMAAYLVAKKTGIPWVAEFQDPIAGSLPGASRFKVQCYADLERRVAESADAVIFMTEAALVAADKRTSLHSRGYCIQPGAYEGRVTLNSGKTDKFVIGHFGALSGGRDIQPVLDAISEVVESIPSAKDDFRLLLMGDLGGGQQSAIRSFRYGDMIDARAKSRREESLKVMSECTMLLLLQDSASVSSETIPSKAYEYMLTGLPIAGLIYRNPELGGMLVKQGHMTSEADDVSGIAAMMKAAYRRWLSGEPIRDSSKDSPYTVDNAAMRLVDIADTVLHDRTALDPRELIHGGV